MTSKLTRERLQEIAEDGFLKHGESKELARMALAAMDSEPVILYRQINPANGMKTYWAELDQEEFRHLKKYTDENAEFMTLYRHAQQPVVESEPVAYISKSDLDAGYPHILARRDFNKACTMAVYAAQPAPQSPGIEPATVPGKWIPVSERMPENDGAYLCWDNRYVTTYAFIFGAWQANQFIAKNITHWMPLPAGPQEVR